MLAIESIKLTRPVLRLSIQIKLPLRFISVNVVSPVKESGSDVNKLDLRSKYVRFESQLKSPFSIHVSWLD